MMASSDESSDGEQQARGDSRFLASFLFQTMGASPLGSGRAESVASPEGTTYGSSPRPQIESESESETEAEARFPGLNLDLVQGQPPRILTGAELERLEARSPLVVSSAQKQFLFQAQSQSQAREPPQTPEGPHAYAQLMPLPSPTGDLELDEIRAYSRGLTNAVAPQEGPFAVGHADDVSVGAKGIPMAELPLTPADLPQIPEEAPIATMALQPLSSDESEISGQMKGQGGEKVLGGAAEEGGFQFPEMRSHDPIIVMGTELTAGASEKVMRPRDPEIRGGEGEMGEGGVPRCSTDPNEYADTLGPLHSPMHDGFHGSHHAHPGHGPSHGHGHGHGHGQGHGHHRSHGFRSPGPRWFHSPLHDGMYSPQLMASSLSSSPFSSRASSSSSTPLHPLEKGYIAPIPAEVQGPTKLPKRMSATAHFRLMALMCLLTVGTGLIYLGWKTWVVASDFTATSITGVLLLVCEWLMFASGLFLVLEVMQPARDREVLSMPLEGPFPQVAIFICCCQEPVDIIQDTIKGALSQHYPSDKYTVWVLDDGGDDKLEAWVKLEAIERYGTDRLKYLRRTKTKGVPHHFKAGNINHALGFLLDEEFVAILDADMIPSRLFLTSLLPHFTSDDVAFVQCPQSFYNLVKGDPLNDSSQDFYDVLLPYRDGRDSAQSIGTGMIMRLSCLREQGGFTVGSITEDSDTSLALHSRGYKSVYVDQRLQAGLAAWSLEGYIKQRQRWATGNLQIMLHRRPMFIKDRRFSLYRRLIYWFAGAQYYMNVVILMTLVLPVVILLFDQPIIPPMAPIKYFTAKVTTSGFHILTTTQLYVLLLAPYVIFSRLLTLALYCRLPDSFRVQLRGDQSWFWMAIFNVQAILKFMFPLLSRKFEATGASAVSSGGLLALLARLRVLWFHILFCVTGLFTVVWSYLHLNYHDCGKLLKVTGWATYILFTVQCMAVPIWHALLQSWHPQPAQRKEMLQYDEAGVPYLKMDQILPKRDWRIVLYAVIPTVWGCAMCFAFYAAVSGFRPKFCSVNGFFDYRRF